LLNKNLNRLLIPEFCTHLAFNGHRGQFFQNIEEHVFYPIACSLPSVSSG